MDAVNYYALTLPMNPQPCNEGYGETEWTFRHLGVKKRVEKLPHNRVTHHDFW